MKKDFKNVAEAFFLWTACLSSMANAQSVIDVQTVVLGQPANFVAIEPNPNNISNTDANGRGGAAYVATLGNDHLRSIVRLSVNGHDFCTGTIIQPATDIFSSQVQSEGTYVLTAAHCFDDFNPQDVDIMGVYSISEDTATYFQMSNPVSHWIPEQYSPAINGYLSEQAAAHDIALLYFSTLPPKDVQPTDIYAIDSMPLQFAANMYGYGAYTNGLGAYLNCPYERLPVSMLSNCAAEVGVSGASVRGIINGQEVIIGLASSANYELDITRVMPLTRDLLARIPFNELRR